jgi:hypothetical protein
MKLISLVWPERKPWIAHGDDCITLRLQYLWRCLSLDDLLRIFLHVSRDRVLPDSMIDAHDQGASPSMKTNFVKKKSQKKKAPGRRRHFRHFRVIFSAERHFWILSRQRVGLFVLAPSRRRVIKPTTLCLLQFPLWDFAPRAARRLIQDPGHALVAISSHQVWSN